MRVGKVTKFASSATNQFIIDSSFILSLLLPDENQSEVVQLFDQYTSGKVTLIAPTLLQYEVINGLKGAILRKRLNLKEAIVLINQFSDLTITIKNISLTEVIKTASDKNISVYDASYLYLSKLQGIPLLTLDQKLQSLVS